MAFKKPEEDLPTEYVEGQQYTNAEKNAIADAILRADTKTELCRECGERGEKTGESTKAFQNATDAEGNVLVIEFDQLACANGHVWYPGEGKERGIGGDNPILFEEHFQSRRRREIYTSQGTPDPEIVSGLYNRSHPQGRKINSEEQRKKKKWGKLLPVAV